MIEIKKLIRKLELEKNKLKQIKIIDDLIIYLSELAKKIGKNL